MHFNIFRKHPILIWFAADTWIEKGLYFGFFSFNVAVTFKLCCGCLCFFLAVSCVGLKSVIEAFPGHTYILLC